jgi:hypothetical protein
LASAARSRNAGEGGTHPACLAMARSSRLAQCSVISPSRVRNQWVWVMANAFWIANDPATYRSLTLGRGLSPGGFETWIRNFYSKMLLY